MIRKKSIMIAIFPALLIAITAKDPHSLVFDSSGILWFSVQEGN